MRSADSAAANARASRPCQPPLAGAARVDGRLQLIEGSTHGTCPHELACHLLYLLVFSRLLRFGARLCQQDSDVLGRHRSVQEVPLEQVGAGSDTGRSMLLGLDALGHDRVAQLVRQGGDRLEDHPIRSRPHCVLHQHAVELQHADRQTSQMSQRRLALAEVVQRQAHAELGDRPQILRVGLVVADDPFAQLDDEVVRREARDFECVLDVGNEEGATRAPPAQHSRPRRTGDRPEHPRIGCRSRRGA